MYAKSAHVLHCVREAEGKVQERQGTADARLSPSLVVVLADDYDDEDTFRYPPSTAKATFEMGFFSFARAPTDSARQLDRSKQK